MRNTTENFPDVPVENLSDWQAVRLVDGETFDVENITFDEKYTQVSFNGETVQFTPQAGEQLKNDEYAVVFKYGGEPVTDLDGVKN